MNNIGEKIIIGIFIIAIPILGYSGWRLKRYFNWKFGYKALVETRIVALEKRIEKIEKFVGIEQNEK